MVTQKKTLVVSGAGGFIGHRLVAMALRDNWAVRALVRQPGKVCFPEHSALSVVAWDISEAQERLDVLKGGDTICHLAAFIPPKHTDLTYALKCFRVNALGTLHLLAATEAVGGPHFVDFSTNLYEPGPGLRKETDPLFPSFHSPFYLTSKLNADYYCADFRQRGLSVTVLRVASVYGPGMGQGGLVPTLAARFAAGQEVEVHDGGRYVVDFAFVDDVVRAALRSAEMASDGVFNIGSGAAYSTLDVALTMAEATGSSLDQITVLPVNEGTISQGFAAMDITRASEELDYKPTPLRDGFHQYVQSLQ